MEPSLAQREEDEGDAESEDDDDLMSSVPDSAVEDSGSAEDALGSGPGDQFEGADPGGDTPEDAVEEELADVSFNEDPFDDTEDPLEGVGTGENDGRDDDDEDADSTSDADDFEATINEGFARLAVVGLPDEWEREDGSTQTKDELQTEFEEVFETFKLGHYGEEALYEYVLVERDDIDPLWGFTAALAISATLVIYMRPDGDEVTGRFGQQLTDTIDGLQEAVSS